MHSAVLKIRCWWVATGLVLGVAAYSGASATGPLRVHPTNPRYFTDGSGKAVYLTGSHTWSSLQDLGPSDPPVGFNFDAYLDFLEEHHHNFIRLWRWELFHWVDVELKAGKYHYEWFDPAKGLTAGSDNLESSGGPSPFKPPFKGDAVLYLKRQ